MLDSCITTKQTKTGNVYEYVKSVLSGRKIIAKIGDSYSSAKNIDMGIPQESIVAPIVFNSIIHDLPKSVSRDTNVVQYADDIAIWMNVSLKKRSSRRFVN